MLLSARSGEEAILEGLDTGADDYLVKPFTTRELVARVQTHLELHRLRNEWAVKLERANQELEAFSYSVSHDLRAPLRHIAGFAALIQRHHATNLDEVGLRRLKMIAESAERMGQMIEDLLGFSRMARTEFRRSRVDLQALTHAVLEELREDTRGRRIRWTIGRLPEVEGDPAMLRLVMANLLGNAVKYTGTREEAMIEVGAVDHGPRGIEVFVRDNGVGFDMANAGRLFGVFQRFHRQDEFPGTGIGLANVSRIVQRHGGRAWGEGVPGQGATFYFSLPRLEPESRGSVTREVGRP
jgi:light-regulated signal transduction histidine kinase (bacteriophytochrome)